MKYLKIENMEGKSVWINRDNIQVLTVREAQEKSDSKIKLVKDQTQIVYFADVALVGLMISRKFKTHEEAQKWLVDNIVND